FPSHELGQCGVSNRWYGQKDYGVGPDGQPSKLNSNKFRTLAARHLSLPKKMDPEGIELRTVLKHVRFEGRDILEIGCGDGRMTFKYAASAKSVVGIDPNVNSGEIAKNNIPIAMASKLEFRIGNG